MTRFAQLEERIYCDAGVVVVDDDDNVVGSAAAAAAAVGVSCRSAVGL